MAIYIEKIGV